MSDSQLRTPEPIFPTRPQLALTAPNPDSGPQQVENRAAEPAKRPPDELRTERTIFPTRHDPNTVTDRLNAVVDSLAETEDRFVSDTTNSILSQVKW